MRSHRDDISADPNMDSHPYDNFLDALAEFTSKNQSKYDHLVKDRCHPKIVKPVRFTEYVSIRV